MIKSEVVIEHAQPDNQERIDESFEEILGWNDVIEEGTPHSETEPLCASCYAPLDVDEEQTIAYCDRCQTVVFVERRYV